MLSSRQSPLWPYLVVLLTLFALTVAIPSWQSSGSSPKATQRPVAEQQPHVASNPRELASVMVVRRTPDSPLVLRSASAQIDPFADEAAAEEPTTSVRSNFAGLFHGPLVEAVAQKIADLRRFGSQQPSVMKRKPPADRVIDFPTTNISATPFPLSGSIIGGETGSGNIFGGPFAPALSFSQLQSVLSRTPVGAEPADASAANHWAAPEALLAQLDRLSQFSGLKLWSEETVSLCKTLCNLTPDDSRQAAEIIHKLKLQAEEADKLAREQTSPQAAVQLRRIHYALVRRLAIWQPVISAPDRASVFANIIARQGQTVSTEPGDVLASIEQYERTGLVSEARSIAVAQQQLKYSNIDAQRELAAQIDEHYRNANVRMAFTGELLGRLLPNQSTTSGVVNDTILGTPVRGVSDTTTQLQVRLIPDSHRIHLWLEARGTVDSRTSASRGPVTLNDRGQSAYIVHKAVVIDGRGLGIAKAMAEADSNTQLIGISTRFDGRPLVSAVVRDRAAARYDKQHAEALCEVDQKVANEAATRVDINARQSLEDLESLIVHQMVSPLERMGVDAQPISFGTTSERVNIRLRLAGENQLGGHTARPQAPSDSLASIQVHESALNNVLDQLDLAGNTFTLPDLFIHLAKRTGRPINVPADLPDEVSIAFAARDPVHVRCQNGVIRLTLAVAELQQRGRSWHDFSISTTYSPEIDHLHARLVRSGPLELGGDTYKGQAEFALRTIFSKVLPRDRKLDLVPPLLAENPRLSGMSLTQCVIDDGWIGIAIGQDRTAMANDPIQVIQ